MIKSACHCGKVALEIDAPPPDSLLSCNCSICRRYGSLLAYYPESKVSIHTKEEDTIRYVWGDEMIAFVACRTCGCFSHWIGMGPESERDRMGVNARLFETLDIEELPIKRFDGAETWTFLDRAPDDFAPGT